MDFVEKFSFEARKAGKIIGRGGETIRALQRDHKVRIDLQKNSNPAKCIISGTDQANVVAAKQAVQELVEYQPMSNGSLGSNNLARTQKHRQIDDGGWDDPPTNSQQTSEPKSSSFNVSRLFNISKSMLAVFNKDNNSVLTVKDIEEQYNVQVSLMANDNELSLVLRGDEADTIEHCRSELGRFLNVMDKLFYEDNGVMPSQENNHRSQFSCPPPQPIDDDDDWAESVAIPGPPIDPKLLELPELPRPSQQSLDNVSFFNQDAIREFERRHGDAPEVIDWAKIAKESQEREKQKWKDLANYYPVRKFFYVEDPAVTALPEDKINEIRQSLHNINVEDMSENKDQRIPAPITTFQHAFGPYPGLLERIQAVGFERPTPVQCQAWPILMSGRDCVAIAQTGTGKTLAFLFPAFLQIEAQLRSADRAKLVGPTALILCPTRELALQIEQEVRKYPYANIRSVCVYGGGDRGTQVSACRRGVEIVIATPGRLNDLIGNRIVRLESVTYLVLDEADRMLDMGFEPQIKQIIFDLRPDRQTVLTSATWPEEVRAMARTYLSDAALVFVGSLDLKAVETIDQHVMVLPDNETKMQRVMRIISEEVVPAKWKTMIFCSRKALVNDLSSDLSRAGIDNTAMHGDHEQCDREEALRSFRAGDCLILVATDVASRGIDVVDVDVVINYDLPSNAEEYVHRVGRTGRAGKCGQAISLLDRDDWGKAAALIEILKRSNAVVSTELQEMANRHAENKARRADGRFGGRGGGGPRRGGRFNREWAA